MNGIAADRVLAALERIEQVDRPELWIHLASRHELLVAADQVDQRLAAGEHLPLAGTIVAVKDNIDVAGMPTTAGAPNYRYLPERDATAVARLRRAGAVVLGKTNLDQFATGLVGTRSPFGAVRNAWDPQRISGGSSSGSAVSVALGIADLALGTDTAGSGRIPAALNGIVGVKPTPGLVPLTGVVPACRSIDCVTVFSRDLRSARLAMELLETTRDTDTSRSGVVMSATPRLAVPDAKTLGPLAPGWGKAFACAVDRFLEAGALVDEVDITPMLEAANMLYGSSFVAERYSAVGEFIEGHRGAIGSDLDPTVAGIILAGKDHSASELFDDRERLEALTHQAVKVLGPYDALLTPTTVDHPTIAEVNADPIGRNSKLGRFTNFANLMGLCSLAVPGGEADGLPFGIMLTGRAFEDHKLVEIAHLGLDGPIRLIVFGLHRRGQSLNHQLISMGADFLATARTAPDYELRRLTGTPARPALVSAEPDRGIPVEGELWRVSRTGLATLLTTLPEHMALGPVRLEGGGTVTGFLGAAPSSALLQVPPLACDQSGQSVPKMTRKHSNG